MVVYDLAPSPYLKANCLSRLFFWWLNGFFGVGCKRPLKIKDLYKTIPDDESAKLGPQLASVWNDQYSKYISQLNSLKAQRKPRKEEKILTPSLSRGIVKVFFKSYMLLGILAVIEECVVRIAQPISLGYMIRYYSHDNEYPEYVKYLTAAGIIVNGIVYMFIHHTFFFSVGHLGMQVRVACCSLMYRKALNLSQSSLQQTAIGKVVNLLANDVNRFDWTAIYLHYLWVGPVQVLIVTGVLWSYIGPCCLIGLAILIMLVPVEMYIGKRFSILRQSTASRTDKRIRILSEILSGIRVIKMYAWEKPFSLFVEKDREDEITFIRKTGHLRAINMTMYMTSAKVIVFFTLLTYVLTGKGLTAELVFVTLALYNNVRLVMTLFFPSALSLLAETIVSIVRIEEFLLLDERPLTSDDVSVDNWIGVHLTGVCAKWDPQQKLPTLTNISFKVDSGKLYAIAGHVGSGKSSILNTILRELPVFEGTVEVYGKLAYVAQEPWLCSGTIKENILLGKPYDPDWYDKVIEACALEQDLDLLPYGDNTLVSDRGQTLSGGQKTRITLARAVYANADIYLLDDPISSVDASVGNQIFSKCINGILKDKVRILVTHQLQFLKFVDYVIILSSEGRIYTEGTYAHLKKTGFDFEQLAESIKAAPKPSTITIKTQLPPLPLLEFDPEQDLDAQPELSKKSSKMKGSSSRASRRPSRKYTSAELLKVAQEFKVEETTEVPLFPFIREGPPCTEVIVPHKANLKEVPEEVEEQQKMGGVSAILYCKYFHAGTNCCILLCLILLSLLSQLAYSGADYWLTLWTESEELKRNNATKYSNPSHPLHHLYNTRNVQLGGYSVIVCLLMLTSWSTTTLFFYVCTRSSISLHKNMFHGIIRAPMQFFENNSAGRILNRFSKDLGQIDDSLPPTAFDAIMVFLNVTGILVVISTVNPILLIPALIMCIIFYFLRTIYIRTSRSVKRLEGITKSPVFSHLSTSLYGLTTIRAFRAEEQFIKQFDTHQDLHTSTWYIFLAASRWFGIWLDWLSLLFVTLVTCSFVFSSKTGAQVGLAVSSAMMLAGFFQWGVRQAAEVENQMVATERVIEYSEILPEAELTSTEDKKPPMNWPNEGDVHFQNISLQYGDHVVLKNITFTAHGSEKIGIVGRTGAGKSTLISVLFRLAEPTGSVVIDNVDVTKIGLHDLRKNVSIIPQEPILFSGTLRRNLDPFDSYSDLEIWNALEWCHLAKEVRDFPLTLNAPVSEGGSNFSLGQRQLLCLGRAILRNNKILVLDEATASVDVETDSLIQKTIQSRFASSTVLIIAHRLHTVMDCDKMLVLDGGKIMEFDEPHILLQDEHSYLRNLVEQTGVGSASDLMKQAQMAHHKRLESRKRTTDEAIQATRTDGG